MATDDVARPRGRGQRKLLDWPWNLWLGNRGERLAARYLKRAGMRILARGYRLRGGEIDLVAREGRTLVFVEVKTRRSGDPFEAITPKKRQLLTRAAFRFVRRFGLGDVPFRFDVVTILWPDPDAGGEPELRHHRHAFEPLDGPGCSA